MIDLVLNLNCKVANTYFRADFFLVSQHVGQGTVSPTHFIVVYDNSGWSTDNLQRLSYKLTHLYYNWPGTVRVPAPCQVSLLAHEILLLMNSMKTCPSVTFYFMKNSFLLQLPIGK